MMSGIARGIMFRLYENLGVISRTLISDQLKEMPDSDKPFLARAGIRIGTETVFMPELLKPAAIKLRVMLYSIYNQDFPACGPPPEGRVSIDLVEGIADNYWLSAGYRRIGDKVMRVDMVERVAALVRTAARSGEFGITDEMLSLAGVGRDIMASMIVGLGFEKVREEPAEDPEKPAKPVFIKKQRQNNKRMRDAKSGESAGRQLNPAINTFIWMYHKHVFTLVKAIYRAHFNTVRIFARYAFIIHNIGHFTLIHILRRTMISHKTSL